MPVSWKGTFQQYAGRLHRKHASKTHATIIDFVDPGHPLQCGCEISDSVAIKTTGYRMETEKDTTQLQLLNFPLD